MEHNNQGPKIKREYTAVFAVVALFSFLLDWLTKLWVLDRLVEGDETPLLGEFITLKLTYNPGAAFSLGHQATWIFTIVTGAVLIALVWYVPKINSRWLAILLGLLAGGAAGNLLDRLIRPPSFARGHVVDFINYNDWFVGNVADIWIVVAAFGLFIYAAVIEQKKKRAETKSVEDPHGRD